MRGTEGLSSANGMKRSTMSAKWRLLVPFYFCGLILAAVLVAQSGHALQLQLDLFLIVFLSVAAVGVTFGNDDLLNPYFVALLLYSLYSCCAISQVLLQSPDSYSASSIHTYYLSVLMGLIGMIAGYRWIRGHSHFLAHFLDRQIVLDQRRVGAIMFLAAFVGIIVQIPSLGEKLNWQAIRPYTSWALESRVQFRADSWSGITSYLNWLTTMLLLGATFFFFINKRSHLARWTIVLGVVYYLLMTVMAGRKKELLSVIFLGFLYLHYRIRSMKPGMLLLPLLLIYTFTVMISHVRSTANIGEMVSNGLALIRTNPEILLPTNAGELNGPPITLLNFIAAKERGEIDISWGYTALTEMMVWVPRAFFPDRPLPLSEQYMLLFFPNDHARGAGHGFFIPTEGYWAFGVIGVFFVMFLYGAAISALYRSFQANQGNNVLLLIYGIAVFALVFRGVRTGLITTFRAVLMDTAPIIILAWISKAHGELKRQPLALRGGSSQ